MLAIGVIKIDSEFKKNDIIAILGPNKANIGFGLASYDSVKTKELAGQKGAKALVHYDYLFVE